MVAFDNILKIVPKEILDKPKKEYSFNCSIDIDFKKNKYKGYDVCFFRLIPFNTIHFTHNNKFDSTK